MSKILISGYYGFNNAGDEAILASIIGSLRERQPNIDITVLSNNPDDTREQYDINAISRKKFSDVWRAMKSSDMLISGGGGLFQDVTSSRSILYYLGLIKMAKLLKKKVVVLANGIGPVRKKFNRYLTKSIVNKVDLITVRDEVSRNVLKRMGVTQKIYLTADPALLLKDTDESKIRKEKLDSMLDFKEEGRTLIGVSVRNWKDFESFSEKIVYFLDYVLENHDVDLLFIPMHYKTDLEPSKTIIGKLKGRAYLVEEELNHHELRYLIGKMDMVIGMRLHSLVFASEKGIPVMGIVYDPKVNSYLEMINQISLGNVENLDHVQMVSLFEKNFNNKHYYTEKMKNAVEELKKLSEKNMDLVMELIESEEKHG